MDDIVYFSVRVTSLMASVVLPWTGASAPSGMASSSVVVFSPFPVSSSPQPQASAESSSWLPSEVLGSCQESRLLFEAGSTDLAFTWIEDLSTCSSSDHAASQSFPFPLPFDVICFPSLRESVCVSTRLTFLALPMPILIH
jgi:hypothetical protein